MRLINIESLELHEFVDPPPYAILSHRWVGEEITYEAYCNPDRRIGEGYKKIVGFCSFVKHRLGAEWAWVDTCCIDKRSSAELSEAINSMWNWYWNSEYCVAYLNDVRSLDCNAESRTTEYRSAVKASDWYAVKRGWTLQEMLAPRHVVICNCDWEDIGEGTDVPRLLSVGSGVPAYYLQNRENIFQASIARRMSWASSRKTTRIEDMAYCLFGLFEINLPLLYGEGERAFIRLQQEIINRTDDESILAWSLPKDPAPSTEDCMKSTGILAPHPSHFWQSGDIYPLKTTRRTEFRVDKKDLVMDCSLVQVQTGLFFLKLNCGSVHPRSGISESQLAAETFSLVPREEKTPYYPSFESRGCILPLTRAGSSFLRTHLNSSTDIKIDSMHSIIGGLGDHIETDYLHRSRIIEHDVHRFVIRRTATSSWKNYNIVVLEMEHHDVLWEKTHGGSWYSRLARQEIMKRFFSMDHESAWPHQPPHVHSKRAHVEPSSEEQVQQDLVGTTPLIVVNGVPNTGH